MRKINDSIVWKKGTALLMAAVMILALLAGCAANSNGSSNASGNAAKANEVPSNASDPDASVPAVEKNGEIYILYTSDVHCAIDQGFGYTGLQQIRDTLEAQGYETILVDDGDSIQGETLGTLTKGEAMIDLMNAMKYDVAIPGNHEFDYGMDRFFELVEKAEFPYICCNFTFKDELVFEPYIIKECAGRKIAFVGVDTPATITSSTPVFFQDDSGEYVYGFMQDDTGEALYDAVQKAVDDARAEGAELVYLLAHLGIGPAVAKWTYADVLSNTSGIDVMFDGHSHDTDQVTMKNKDGDTVVRSACGTKLECIGYSHISADGKILKTGIWSWPNSDALPDLTGIENSMTPVVEETLEKLRERLGKIVARSAVELTMNDPVEKDSSGNPIRMVRRAETNIGDFCADALRAVTGAEIAILGGGGIRKNIAKGEITYGDIINVHPYNNQVCVISATGQQILDALEWGAHLIPGEFGGFMQVSGLSYTIDATVPSPCSSNENSMFTGVEGQRRVKDVYVGDQPLDPEKYYSVAGTDYVLLNNGDGLTAFDGAEVLQDGVKLDNQALIDYVTDFLNGEIGAEYADPYGTGRITIYDGRTE